MAHTGQTVSPVGQRVARHTAAATDGEPASRYPPGVRPIALPKDWTNALGVRNPTLLATTLTG